MSDLSSKPRALVDAARGAKLRSSDRARIRAGLDAKLALVAAATAGATALHASSATAGGAAAGAAVKATAKVGVSGLFWKIVVGTALFGAVGFAGKTWVVPRFSSGAPKVEAASMAAPEGSALVAPTASVVEADAPAAAPLASATIAVADEPAPDTSASPPQAKREPSARSAVSNDPVSIAAELALLRQAQAALKDGDSARSLAALDALAARHPEGALREERLAARVLALCAAGRVDDARVAGRRFVAELPRSVQAPRVRASCAFAPKSK